MAFVPFENIRQYEYEDGRGQVTYIAKGMALTCRHLLNLPYTKHNDLVWIASPHVGQELTFIKHRPTLGSILTLIWIDHGFLKIMAVSVAFVYGKHSYAIFHPTLKQQHGLSGAFVWNGSAVAGIVTGRQAEDSNILWVERPQKKS